MNKFYKYIKETDAEFNKRIYFTSGYNDRLVMTLFNILLLNHSDVLQNFLIYYNEVNEEKITIASIFSAVVLREPNETENPYVNYKYDSDRKTLFIYPSNNIDLLDDLNSMANQLYNVGMSVKASNILEYVYHRKLYIKPDFFNKIHPIYSSLDVVLKELPEFTKLNHEIKKRILNGEFLEKYNKEHTIKEINIDELLESIKKSKKRILNSEYQDLNDRYRNYKAEINHILENMQKIQMETIGIDSYTIDGNKLGRVLNDSRIHEIEIIDNYLFIRTEPILLNYDRNKVQAIARLKHLPPSHNLGIGRHTIQVDLRTFNLRFSPIDDFRNHHIEDYTCYGTFSNPIDDARREMNLPKLISLALQMLQYATIGDVAGNSTINNAYEVTANNSVVHAGKEYYHHKFLDNYPSIKHLGNDERNYEDLEETERIERERIEEELANILVDDAIEEQENNDTTIEEVARREYTVHVGGRRANRQHQENNDATIEDAILTVLDEADEVNGVTREERQERRVRYEEEDAIIAEGLGENTNENN